MTDMALSTLKQLKTFFTLRRDMSTFNEILNMIGHYRKLDNKQVYFYQKGVIQRFIYHENYVVIPVVKFYNGKVLMMSDPKAVYDQKKTLSEQTDDAIEVLNMLVLLSDALVEKKKSGDW